MARNSRVLVRQLLGNPLNPCAALLHHHNHKHPLSFIKTLTVSVPITPSLPPRPPPPAIPSSSKLFCTLDSSSKKEIIIGSYSRWSINYKGYSDIPLILLHNHYDQYVSAVKTIQVSHVTSDMFMEMCEPFPHVIAYPTFHFYQNGKKVAEITRKSWESEAYEISLKKTLVKLYV
ncbi:hypothetical protein C1H46_019379 [Malus baccata]|uniref:Thioredoxin domain-containing protein n=1 Tax=Malus baccata TaxID=106549 RepID=A0A540M8F6_MALBA|nr:hypothetical protein C1H46_019379 [Malus baccata]